LASVLTFTIDRCFNYTGYICKGLRPWVDTGLRKFQILFLELVYTSFKFYFWNWFMQVSNFISGTGLVYASFRFYFWNWFTQVSNFISGTGLHKSQILFLWLVYTGLDKFQLYNLYFVKQEHRPRVLDARLFRIWY
jgi:hypothetical protein